MSEELKPCPFCGPHEYFKPELIYRGLEGHHDIVCPQCGAKKWCEAWERRPIEDALRSEVAQLNEAFVSQQRHLDYVEITRRCHSMYAKRPILYTDTVTGEQCCVDNLWAVSTQELNEAAALQGAVNDAMALVLSHEGHIDKMNERAEQAGAEWTRAREAWKAFSGNDPDAVAILDQFFGSDER